MLKETARDYIVDAFRYYSALKRPNAASAQKKADFFLQNYHNRNQTASFYSLSPIAPDVIKQKLDAEIADLRAVEETLQILRMRPEGKDILHAIETVYFFSPYSPQKKCDITDRVRCASLEIPASERTVYYYLSLARKTFAQQRGLRMKQKKNEVGLSDILSANLNNDKKEGTE